MADPTLQIGVNNPRRLTTLYIPPERNGTWVTGRKLSKALGFKSMSAYVLALIQANAIMAEKKGIKIDV